MTGDIAYVSSCIVVNNSNQMYFNRLCPNDGLYMNLHHLDRRLVKCIICTYTRLEKPLLTLENYFAGRDKDPKYIAEFSEEIKANAILLIDKVNLLLQQLGIKDPKVSSGWRPPSFNATVPHASKKSAHMVGMAVDLSDPGHKIYDTLAAHPEELRKLGLWLEGKEDTPNWCHLDYRTRQDRPSRVFKA